VDRPISRRLLATLLACLGLLAAAPAPAADSGPPTPLGADALWAWWWETPDALARSVGADSFDRVYLFAEGGFGRKVRRTIRLLNEEGIAVEALGGESRWATTQRGGMVRFVHSARAYQRSAPAGARLAGIHLDVEPYGLRAWKRDRDGTARALVRSMAAARRVARRLPVAADIPFWFDGITMGDGPGTLAASIIRRTDSTTIMAYRDSGSEVVDVAHREIRIAGRLGRETTVGLETAPVSPSTVTFNEEGRAALAEAVGQIRSRFESSPGFGGIAIHHYGSLQSLRP
jgi:hypothetical protein